MPAKKAPKERKQKEVLEFAPPKAEIRFKQRKFAFTEKQKSFISQITDPKNKVIFIKGPAGTSKTLISIYAGLLLLKDHDELSLMYLRSIVESASHSAGFLPGDRATKEAPYLEILQDKMFELLTPSDKISLEKSGRIEGGSVNYLRGRNFIDKFILVDETQNLTEKEILTLMTRIGQNSKLVLTADPVQSDIRNSGFEAIWNKFTDEDSRQHGIIQLEFTSDDCVRSEIVRFILKKFGL